MPMPMVTPCMERNCHLTKNEFHHFAFIDWTKIEFYRDNSGRSAEGKNGNLHKCFGNWYIRDHAPCLIMLLLGACLSTWISIKNYRSSAFGRNEHGSKKWGARMKRYSKCSHYVFELRLWNEQCLILTSLQTKTGRQSDESALQVSTLESNGIESIWIELNQWFFFHFFFWLSLV